MISNRRLLALAPAIGFLTTGAGDASAAFVFQTQTRSVSGQAIGPAGQGNQTINAPNFGVFDATTSVTAPTYGGFIAQHQRSELLSNLIKVTGDLQLSRPAAAGQSSAYADTNTDVTFTVSQPTPVTLQASGTLTNSALFNARAIRLVGPNATINWGNGFSPGLFPEASGTHTTSLTLDPGSWRFLVHLASSHDSNGFSSVPSFSVQLSEVPEPALLAPALIGFAPLVRTRRKKISPRFIAGGSFIRCDCYACCAGSGGRTIPSASASG